MLVAEVQACIEAHSMLSPRAKVIVAVSGGADSISLLFALAQLRSVYDFTLIVAHVNHQLRGDEAERDALFVEQQAARLELPFYQTRVDVTALQRRLRTSLQHAARQGRYQFFHALCQTLGATRVALGHTADDQAETFLMRLLHGGGPAGLAGIPAVRLPFIRPLIAVSRHTIHAYLQAENLAWVEDHSNTHPVYLRNRVRLDLLPKLQQYNPQIVRRLNELADMLRAESQMLESQVDEWLVRTLAWQGSNRAAIQCGRFGTAPIAIQRRLLRRVIAALSNLSTSVSFRHVEGLRQFIIAESYRRHGVLPGDLHAERHRDTVLLWNARRVSERPSSFTLAVPGEVDILDLDIRLIADIVDKPHSFAGMSPQWALLDFERITCPLQVRFRQPGDKFYPLGAPGSKKLQDFFIDSRIPRAERSSIPLVVSNREIVWVVGYRIAEPFKLRPETKRVLRLQSHRLHEVNAS